MDLESVKWIGSRFIPLKLSVKRICPLQFVLNSDIALPRSRWLVDYRQGGIISLYLHKRKNGNMENNINPWNVAPLFVCREHSSYVWILGGLSAARRQTQYLQMNTLTCRDYSCGDFTPRGILSSSRRSAREPIKLMRLFRLEHK